MVHRPSAAQQERIAEIQGYLRTLDRIERLVAEADGSRAASITVINNLFSSIERELSQLRERARGAAIGTVADHAGEMAVMAGRPLGVNIRIRGLTEGLQGLRLQLEGALAKATQVPRSEPKAPAAPDPPA